MLQFKKPSQIPQKVMKPVVKPRRRPLKFSIRPLEAKLNKDTGTFTAMQVYCEMQTIDGKAQKTATAKGKNPKWTEQFELEVRDIVIVRLYSTGLFVSDTLIGRVDLSLNGLIGKEKPSTEWYMIQNDEQEITGQIMLCIECVVAGQDQLPKKQQIQDHSVIQMVSQHSSGDEEPMQEASYGEEEEATYSP